MRKIITIFVILLMVVTGANYFFGEGKTAKTFTENFDTDKNSKFNNLQTMLINYYIGRSRVMSNGNCAESYAKVYPEYPENQVYIIELDSPDTVKVSFTADYKIDCWGLCDWGKAWAIVDGETKSYETDGNKQDTFAPWYIEIYPGKTITWKLKARYTDWVCNNDKTVQATGEIKFIYNPPDLEDLNCYGSISASEVEPGSQIKGEFYVQNNGDSGTYLNWEVYDYPNFGSGWSCSPSSGTNLQPEDEDVRVTVRFNAPNTEEASFSGSIRVRNTQNHSMTDTVPVSGSTPVAITKNLHMFPLIQSLLKSLEKVPRLFNYFKELFNKDRRSGHPDIIISSLKGIPAEIYGYQVEYVIKNIGDIAVDLNVPDGNMLDIIDFMSIIEGEPKHWWLEWFGVLEPGEESPPQIIYGAIRTGWPPGTKFALILDPLNQIDEGEDGENNNFKEMRFPLANNCLVGSNYT